MLIATMAMFALSSAATASPTMSVMDRIYSDFGEKSNAILSTMRDIDITDRNMDDWWTQYNTQITGFKKTIEGKDITEENKDADPLVCKNHKAMMQTLTGIKTQWAKVWSAWEAKNKLLNLIWGILTKDKSDDASGLHCNKDGQSGDAKQLCDLLTKLMAKSVTEETELKKEETTINGYITNVSEYKCDCTFDKWDGGFGPCEGGTVKPVDIYKECENAEKMMEAEGKLICKPTKGFCGEGTQSKTRTRLWDAKDGGEGELGQKCQVGEADEGTYSEVDKDEKQTLTADCKAGEFDGRCPIDCQWAEWSDGGDIDTAACGAKTCDDNGKSHAKQVITRKKKTTRKDGGKFCFQNYHGHYDTQEKACIFETTTLMASVKMSEEKAKYESLVGVIKKEMCKGGNGPCGENGVCKVETNEDGEITSWCKCNDGFSGDWCEKIVVVEDVKEDITNVL